MRQMPPSPLPERWVPASSRGQDIGEGCCRYDYWVYYRDPATFHEDIKGPLSPPLPESDLQGHITQLRNVISEQLQSQILPPGFVDPGVPVDFIEMHRVTNGITSAGIPSENSAYELVRCLPSFCLDPPFEVWRNVFKRTYRPFDLGDCLKQEIVAAFELGGDKPARTQNLLRILPSVVRVGKTKEHVSGPISIHILMAHLTRGYRISGLWVRCSLSRSSRLHRCMVSGNGGVESRRT